MKTKYTALAFSFIAFVGCTEKAPDLDDQADLQDENSPGDYETGISGLNKSRGGTNGDFDYCARSSCTAGEGDCDSNAECAPGLICMNNVGPRFGQPLDWDYCLGPLCNNGIQDQGETGIDVGGLCGTPAVQCPTQNGTATFCSSTCPCSSGEGDCDRAADCDPGLSCVANNGPSWGMPANFDVCVPAQCANKRRDVNEVGIDCGGPCGTCFPKCGNMVVDQGETCDDGNRRAGDGCEPNCQLPASQPGPQAVCGNGAREGFEECDDGNVTNSDGCSAVCLYETVCGNAVTEAGEQCDDGNVASGDGCVGCMLEGAPGDGTVNAGEQCDDGNVASGDGCSSAMLCEDGTVLTFEGLANMATVGSFYNGGAGGALGIEFGASSLALIDSDAGGSGNFGGEPSASTILFFLSGSAVMNVPAGFSGGFSVYYSAIASPGTIRVFDGPNGTGNVLQTVYLPITPSNGGDPNGAFSPFYPVGVTFPGTAHSVDFGGVADQIGMDDIRINACQQ